MVGRLVYEYDEIETAKDCGARAAAKRVEE